VPNGFGERGLPTSLQFVGRAWGENAILAAARAYQSRTDWHRRHPPGC
jgi:aspartyl-tRNA(Asn)/glutamyl-tRNA(Gln) amidotransferase subunit A